MVPGKSYTTTTTTTTKRISPGKLCGPPEELSRLMVNTQTYKHQRSHIYLKLFPMWPLSLSARKSSSSEQGDVWFLFPSLAVLCNTQFSWACQHPNPPFLSEATGFGLSLSTDDKSQLQLCKLRTGEHTFTHLSTLVACFAAALR